MALSKTDMQLIIKQLGLPGLEVNGDTFNFRCPVCGDSKKDPNKKRGFFYWDTKNNKGYRYKCFNCNVSYSFEYYLKLYEPILYREYIFDKFKSGRIHKNTFKFEKKDHVEKVGDIVVKKFLNDKIKSGLIKNIPKIKVDIVRDYLYDRQVPRNKLKNLFYIENFYSNLYEPLKVLIKTITQEEVRNIYETDPRVFWFIKNRANEIVGIQGRSLNPKSKLRYLTIKITDDVMVGNIEKIQPSERVYVTEGYFDSLFLPNAVSLNGSGFKQTLNELKKIKSKEIVFVFDNEPYNNEIRKKVKEAVDMSISDRNSKIGICLLPKSIRNIGKDINEYIKNGIDKQKLLNIIIDNTYYRSTAKIQMLKW